MKKDDRWEAATKLASWSKVIAPHKKDRHQTNKTMAKTRTSGEATVSGQRKRRQQPAGRRNEKEKQMISTRNKHHRKYVNSSDDGEEKDPTGRSRSRSGSSSSNSGGGGTPVGSQRRYSNVRETGRKENTRHRGRDNSVDSQDDDEREELEGGSSTTRTDATRTPVRKRNRGADNGMDGGENINYGNKMSQEVIMTGRSTTSQRESMEGFLKAQRKGGGTVDGDNTKSTLKEFVRSSIFKNIKFVVTDQEIEFGNHICNAVLVNMKIAEDQKRDWWSAHKKVVQKSLADKRSTTNGMMKLEVVSEFERGSAQCFAIAILTFFPTVPSESLFRKKQMPKIGRIRNKKHSRQRGNLPAVL